jgi:hypothetical protein
MKFILGSLVKMAEIGRPGQNIISPISNRLMSLKK